MNPKSLNINSFQEYSEKQNVLIVDTRHQDSFVQAHIPNSLFLGVDGPFEIWVKLLLTPTSKDILLVTPPNREKEVIEKLIRYKVTNIVGYLEGGFTNWKINTKNTNSISSISATEFKTHLKNDISVFDVRKINEYETAHLKHTTHTPLNFLENYLEKYPKNKPFYIFCGGGYRSVITASILKSKGYNYPINIKGGFRAIQKAEIIK